MEHNQNKIAEINYLHAVRIKCGDHSWLFCQSLKKLAVVERLYWQLGTQFTAVKLPLWRGLNKSQCMNYPPGQKKVVVVERLLLVKVQL